MCNSAKSVEFVRAAIMQHKCKHLFHKKNNICYYYDPYLHGFFWEIKIDETK